MGKGPTDSAYYKASYISVIFHIMSPTFSRLKPESSHAQSFFVARVLTCDLGFTNQTYPGVTSAKETASGDRFSTVREACSTLGVAVAELLVLISECLWCQVAVAAVFLAEWPPLHVGLASDCLASEPGSLVLQEIL